MKCQLAVVTADSDSVRVLCQMAHIFSHAQYADMLYVYVFCDGSATAVVEEYRRRFPMHRFPNRREFSMVLIHGVNVVRFSMLICYMICQLQLG